MQWRMEGAADALHSPIPWVAFSAAVALAFAGWIGLERNRVDEARAQFERRTETAEGAVRTRLAAYEQVLRSAAARIASEPAITSGEWHDFIEHLQLEERFPGIQSVAYARRLKDDGFPTVFAEPATTRNANLIGYDPFRDPVRRGAMERARDTGEASISGKVTFSGNARAGMIEHIPGFVMAVPVFRQDVRGIPYSQRDAELSGYVLGTFRMQDLMRGILDEGVLQVLDMRVYDEPNATEGNLLIDTRTAWRANPSSEPPTFSRHAAFPVQGRMWTVVFLSRPEVDAAISASRPWAVLAAGLVASILIFVLTLALVASWNRAHHLSMRDPLTGLYNRRYLEETMTRELPRARRLGESVGVLVVDIDHFKRLNDTFGHDAGDFVLERTGEMLRAATRNSDIACRFGGEEFAVILPGAALLVARNRAEGIRTAIESMQLDFDGRNLGPLTVSIGVAAMPPHVQDWSFTLQQADRALYTAKQAGRNRVVAAVDD
ncbi:MAG TPA: diguanylate cyclase [Usitatibacter sp.]|nr:diguanylate cyclase [Usitatibacter sp.]